MVEDGCQREEILKSLVKKMKPYKYVDEDNLSLKTA